MPFVYTSRLGKSKVHATWETPQRCCGASTSGQPQGLVGPLFEDLIFLSCSLNSFSRCSLASRWAAFA